MKVKEIISDSNMVVSLSIEEISMLHLALGDYAQGMEDEESDLVMRLLGQLDGLQLRVMGMLRMARGEE